MASKPAQKCTRKKKRVSSSSKKYDHNLPPPEVGAYQRQNAHANKVIDINLKRLENYMWTKPTLAQTALFFDVSQDTIESTIKLHYALSYSDFREQRLQHTKHSLIQHTMALATEGDRYWPALKFALQNLVGWSENMQMAVAPNQVIQLRYALDAPPENPMIDVTPAKVAEGE